MSFPTLIITAMKIDGRPDFFHEKMMSPMSTERYFSPMMNSANEDYCEGIP